MPPEAGWVKQFLLETPHVETPSGINCGYFSKSHEYVQTTSINTQRTKGQIVNACYTTKM